MAVVTIPIPPFTVPVGTTVFGPAVVVGSWSNFTLTLDLAGLVSGSLLIEESSNLGVSWTPVWSIDGMVGDPLDSPSVTAITIPLRTSARVRATLTNTVAFASTGGSLVVT
jgi:hypothetical protein